MDFTAGYKFGPNHRDIHYVINGHGSPSDDYQTNFSTDIAKAKIFQTAKEAEEAAFALTQPFRLDRSEYHWCALVADGSGNEVTIWELA